MTETCAECGKAILSAGWTQNDPWGKGGPSKHYHLSCGDPLGLKAKDAEIERLRKHPYGQVIDEQKTEIERLRDENELLRDTKGCTILDQKAEIERLRAASKAMRKHKDDEIARLRTLNAELLTALIQTRTFIKTYQRSNVNWHNDNPTWRFVHDVLNVAIEKAERP